MLRVQFYPGEALKGKLDEDAKRLGVSVSTRVSDILNGYYGLVKGNTRSESDITKIVFEEIEAYVNNPCSKPEFDLLGASPTFAMIEMTCASKPSVIRAKIGKRFAAQVGLDGPFKNVSVAKRNGKVKKNANNATRYEIKKNQEGDGCD